jgi:hypothetical protein
MSNDSTASCSGENGGVERGEAGRDLRLSPVTSLEGGAHTLDEDALDLAEFAARRDASWQRILTLIDESAARAHAIEEVLKFQRRQSLGARPEALNPFMTSSAHAQRREHGTYWGKP